MKMAFCLRAIKTLGDQDLGSLTDKVEAYVKAGMESKAAEMAAVDDMLAEVRQDRDELHSAIREQHPELFVQSKAARGEAKPAMDEVAAAAPAAPEKKLERLTDAGEELIRNRRGKLKGLAWDDVSAMNDTLKVAQVVKTNVWPRTDYAKMVEDGAPAWKVAALKAVYDKLAAAPVTRAAPTDADLRAYIETMHQVRDTLLAELDRVAALPDGAELWKTLSSRNVFGKVFPIPADARPVYGAPSPFDRVSEQGKENNRRALLIGGNAAAQALQFNYKVLSKVKDLLAEGFPAKQESWQKSYEVRQTDTRDNDVPDGERTGKQQQRFYIYEKGSRWRLAKGGQDGGYATQEQAEAFARSLIAKPKKEVLPPSRGLDLTDAARTGPDWRNGEDVTADQVMAHFGFRGVNLGEYVKAKQNVAQLHLNHVYDAFSDLADLLGVPPKAMSLNGTLGVAIGAQGSGKALAHFVPGVNEINITRDSGAGALAHEFGHAADHYFATQHGRAASMAKRPYLSAVVENIGDAGGVRPEVMAAMRAVMKTLNSRAMTEAEARKHLNEKRELNQRRMDRWVKEFSGNKGADPAALTAVAEKLKRGDVGEAQDGDVEANLSEFMRAAGLKPGNAIAANAFTLAYRLRDLTDEARFLASHIPQVDTDYAKASAAMDAKKAAGEGYWSTPWEKFARAFETFAMDALQDRQRESLYLSGLVDSEAWASWSAETGKTVPYPAGAERLEMQQAFQKLVDTIQTRTDDAGNVAMFSRNAVAKDVAQAWRILSENDEVFTYPKSESTDFAEIANGTDAIFAEPEPGTVGANVERAWRIYPAPGGVPDKSKRGHVIHYKGGKVELNVEKFTEGSAGSAAYAAVGNYAFNNGLEFMPDRFGLTQAAIERRLENLISLALKFGSTDFIRLSPNQLKAFKMKWRDGDTAFNTEQMLMASYNALASIFPEIKDYTYDLNTGARKSNVGAVGRDDAGTEGIVARARAAGARAGQRTVARAIFTNTFAAEPSGKARRELLGRFGDGDAGLLGDNALAKSLYSRAPGARVDLDAADAVGREFWRKIDNGESFTDQEVLDALATNRRGTVREARTLQDLANFGGTGEAAIGWQGDLAGFGPYSSRATWDGDHFSVFFIPDSIAANADLSDLAQARDRALVHVAFTPAGEGKYLLSLNDPKSGSTAERAAVAAQVAAKVGRDDSPYTRIDLAAGDVTSRTALQEAARRLALNIGVTPSIKYDGRDTGARAGQPNSGRGKGADDVRNKFSRSEGQPPASARRQDVEALVAQVASRWANAPEVVVIDSLDDPRVPESVRQDEQTQQSRATAGVPEGFFHDGKVYLIAPQLGGDADVIRVLFHESLGHFGLRGTFGPELGGILDRLAVLNAAKVRAKALQYGLDYDSRSDRRIAAEEVLAEMAQATPELGLIQRAIAAVRTWLREHVPGFSAMKMSDAELIRSFILPAMAFVQRGGPAVGVNGGPAMFSRATSASAAGQSIADRLRNAGGGPKIVGDTGRYTPRQLASMRNVGREVIAPTLEERAKAIWKDIGTKMAQGLVDQFAPVKDIDKDAYGLLRLAKGASGAFEAILKGGKLILNGGVYDFDTTQRGGVIDTLLKPLGGEHHDFLWWVAANRAERLSNEWEVTMPDGRTRTAQGQQAAATLVAANPGATAKAASRERLFDAEDIAAHKTLADGRTDFDYTIQNGANAGTVTRDRTLIYKDALVTFNGFNKNALDMAEQSGGINAEWRANFEHEFYLPFYRVDEEAGTASIFGANTKGGAVRQEFAKQLKGGKSKLNTDLLDNTLMNWAHLLDAAAKNRAASATLVAAEQMGKAVSADESTAREMAKAAGKKDNVVWVMDEGVKHFYVVEDKMLLTALTSLEYAGMRSPIMTALGSFKHAMTIGVTASPFFKVRNLIRDSVQAIGTAPLGYNPASNIAQGWALTDPKSDAYFRLLAGGGTIHFGTMMEGSEARRVQALVESGVDKATILNSDQKVKAFYRKFIKPSITAYNELGNRGEAITRAALYAQLTAQGMSHAQASLQARDLMDFSMQGSFTSVRFLAQVVPFFNARLQGLYKLGRAAKEDPARFSAVIGAATLAGLSLMLAYSDDDDWKKREDWDRNGYWWFKFGGVAFRIPKPFEIGAIASLAERGFEYAFDKEMTGKRFRSNVLSLLGDNLSMNPIPQMAKPLLDVYANKDSFTGRPIENMGMARLKSEYRFTSNTSMLARGASTVMNAATGLVGAEALSPVQVYHMLRGYFGWLGTFVVGVGDILARPLTGQPDKPDSDILKAATGGMLSDLRDAPSRYVSQMYEQAKSIEKDYATWRELLKDGKVGEAQEFYADHREDINKHKALEHTKAAEAKVSQQIKRIETGDMTGAEKRERIRELLARKDRIARPVMAVN